MGDAEYQALAELGALRSVTDASQPHQRSKVPAAQKQLLFGEPWCRKPGWQRSCQGCVGERARRHGVLTGAEKLEVRLGSGFPEGETSPEAMKAAGSGAVFCKYLGILRNLKKTSRRQEFSEDEGIRKEPDLGSALSWMLRAASNAVLGSSPGTPRRSCSSRSTPGAERSCQDLGRGLGCAHHPAEARGNPPQTEDQSLGLRLIPPTWHQMHRMMGTNGCLCFTAARHKESPKKSPRSWPKVSWKQGVESPGGRRGRRSQHKVAPWATVAQAGHAVGSASRLGFDRPGFHALGLGKDHGDIKVLSAGEASWS